MPGGMILNALYVYCHRRVTSRSHSPLTPVLQWHLNPHRQSGLQGHGFILVMVTFVNALGRSAQIVLQFDWLTSPRVDRYRVGMASKKRHHIRIRRGTKGEFWLSWSYEKRDITLGEDGGRGSFDLTPGNCHDLPSESSLRWAFVKNGKLCWNCENIPPALSSTYMTENGWKTHFQQVWISVKASRNLFWIPRYMFPSVPKPGNTETAS